MNRFTLSLLLLGASALTQSLAQTAAQSAQPATSTPASTPAPVATPPTTEKSLDSMTVSSSRGYTIKVWPGWSKPIGGAPGADVAFVSKAIGGLRPTITVVVQDVPADLKATLADFRDLYEKNFTKDVPKFKMLGEKTVKVSGNPAILWTYTGDGDGGTVRWTQVFTLKNNRLYTATLMTPTGTPADVLASGRKALDSLQLK